MNLIAVSRLGFVMSNTSGYVKIQSAIGPEHFVLLHGLEAQGFIFAVDHPIRKQRVMQSEQSALNSRLASKA